MAAEETNRKEKGNFKKVIRKPANIAKIDDSITVIQIDSSVKSKPVEDLETGRVYHLIRTFKGIQMH